MRLFVFSLTFDQRTIFIGRSAFKPLFRLNTKFIWWQNRKNQTYLCRIFSRYAKQSSLNATKGIHNKLLLTNNPNDQADDVYSLGNLRGSCTSFPMCAGFCWFHCLMSLHAFNLSHFVSALRYPTNNYAADQNHSAWLFFSVVS